MTPTRYQRLQNSLKQRQLDLTLVMENVHKSHNFSAVLRSCEAVGLLEVHAVTSGGNIPQHHDTAAGANKWLNVHSYSDIKQPYKKLRTQGYQILTANLTEDSQDFREIDYTKPTAIVMGSELSGISETAQNDADQNIFIPIFGLVESLNVSVAAAIILYEAQRQRQIAGLYQTNKMEKDLYKKTLFEWCYPDIASRYQKASKPYPELDQDGYILTEQLNIK